MIFQSPRRWSKRGNSQAQGDTGVWGSRNQSPSLLSSILVGEGDGSDDGSLVIYRGTDQISTLIIMKAMFLIVRRELKAGMIDYLGTCLFDILLVTRNTYYCHNLNNHQMEKWEKWNFNGKNYFLVEVQKCQDSMVIWRGKKSVQMQFS